MYLFVNEHSFIGQSKSADHAGSLIRTLIALIRRLKPIQGEDPLCTHSTLYDKELWTGYTVRQWMSSRTAQRQRDVFTLFLQLVTKGPHTDLLLDQELQYHECSCRGKDVTGSSIAGACHLEGPLLSLQDAPEFEDNQIPVIFRDDQGVSREENITNLTLADHAWLVRPRYESNPKHDASMPSHGVVGTPMDLDNEQAQQALDIGFQHELISGKRIYSYYQTSYYVFMPHHDNMFHGYPVDEGEVPYSMRIRIQKAGLLG